MDKWIQHPHVVRTTNMTDVMLTGSGGIKAGLEERMLNRFHSYFVKKKITDAMISRCCSLTEP